MAIMINNHSFKGHKALLGSKFVTYGEVELQQRTNLYDQSKTGFDWGNSSKGANQLAFAMLFQLSDAELATKYAEAFTNDVIKSLTSRDWIMQASDVLEWIEKNCEVAPQQVKSILFQATLPNMKALPKKVKTNVVKEVCKELGITQKNLAEVLEIPEGTVSSWAVKNEIPRLGKKAIEFYIQNTKNEKIIESYKSFMNLLQAS